MTRVEMTMDGGVTWQLCELEHVEKPNKYGKYWRWCFWSLEVKVVELFGAEEIAVRAWDESNNTAGKPQLESFGTFKKKKKTTIYFFFLRNIYFVSYCYSFS